MKSTDDRVTVKLLGVKNIDKESLLMTDSPPFL